MKPVSDSQRKEYETHSFRVDRADVVPTSRVGFSGIIGTLEQTPSELHKDMEKEVREDYGEVSFVQDANGMLRGRAVITTIGVYPYLKKDGSVEWELRHPDDVYAYDSLKTLEMLTLTNDHPSEQVNQDNVKDLQVGHLGEFVLVDTMHGYITNTVVVTDSKAIADVNGGKRALSAGYRCDVTPETGTWNGTPYTARQKNIRYNHASIVKRGRAGDDAVMKFDSFDGIQTNVVRDKTVQKTDVNTDEEVTMGDKNFKSVKLDGVDYEAEPAVITALHQANERLNAAAKLGEENEKLKADKATAEGERDAHKETIVKMKKDLDSSIKTDQLEPLFQKRQKLDEAGALAKIEDFDKMDTKGKMEAVVLKVSPNAKEALDSRKDSDQYITYLESRFDSAVESLRNDSDILAQNLGNATGTSTPGQSRDDSKEIKSDEENWKALVDASKKKAE
jgi:hypothetical protein